LISAANHHASLPIGYRMYLPKEWADDEERRRKAGVPEDVTFKTKPEIALNLVKQALKEGAPRGVVLADAAYGSDTGFRDALTKLGLPYAMGIGPGTSVWAPGKGPVPPPPRRSGRGRPPARLRRDEDHQPVAVKALALTLKESDWETVTWREGTDKTLKSRFARLWVRPAHKDYLLTNPRLKEWLVIEWPEGEAEPTRYWLSTLDVRITFEKLVDTIKLRWRIERATDASSIGSSSLKIGALRRRAGTQAGTWPRTLRRTRLAGISSSRNAWHRGFGLLISERETVLPSGASPARRLKKPAIPESYRPRGSPPPHPASYAGLDRHYA
jgi:SRSO17 transposase